jgi:hypothetical protein
MVTRNYNESSKTGWISSRAGIFRNCYLSEKSTAMKHLFKLFTIAILLSGLMIFSRCGEEEVEFPITLENVDACLPAGVKDTTIWTTLNSADITNLISQSPAGGNFDDIIAVDMWFREVGDNTMGTKVAYLTNIADNSVTANLESQFSELVDFLSLDQFQAGVHINQEPFTTEALCVQGTVVLNVTAGGD